MLMHLISGVKISFSYDFTLINLIKSVFEISTSLIEDLIMAFSLIVHG